MTTTLIYADEIQAGDILIMTTGYGTDGEPVVTRQVVTRVRTDSERVSIIARDTSSLKLVPVHRSLLEIFEIEERAT